MNYLKQTIALLLPTTIAVALTQNYVDAAGFGGIWSDHDQLKGSVIVDVGDAREVPPPTGASWKNQVYSLNSRCFTIFGYIGYWGFGGKPALLIVNEKKMIQLAILETSSFGGIDVNTHLVQMVNCPEHANIIPSCDGLTTDECAQILEQYEQKLDRMLKELSE